MEEREKEKERRIQREKVEMKEKERQYNLRIKELEMQDNVKPKPLDFSNKDIDVINFKAFSKFCRRHFDMMSKYNVGLKTLLLQPIAEPEFYGDLEYKFRKIIGKNNFLIISKR